MKYRPPLMYRILTVYVIPLIHVTDSHQSKFRYKLLLKKSLRLLNLIDASHLIAALQLKS